MRVFNHLVIDSKTAEKILRKYRRQRNVQR
jgi:DNA-binding transcriptional regulator LsrR (DeoR family)